MEIFPWSRSIGLGADLKSPKPQNPYCFMMESRLPENEIYKGTYYKIVIILNKSRAYLTFIKMQNDEQKIVDLYIPRKCSATNRLITAKDHASVQIDIAEVDENGKITGKKKTIALAGFMRSRGEADACINRLLADMELLSFRR